MSSDLVKWPHRVARRAATPGPWPTPREVPSMADATPAPERWLPVVGWEGWYEVSDQGRVHRVAARARVRTGGMLAAFTDRKGYRRVQLSQAGRRKYIRVHQLVSQAFLDPAPAGYEVNHRDGDKGNNRPSNLEWVTRKANMEHAIRTGLMRTPGLGHGSRKLTPRQVIEIRQLQETLRPSQLAARFGISDTHVRDIVARRRWAKL